MPNTLRADAPRRPDAVQTESVIRVRAELVSIGGGVLLLICLVVTAVLIGALLYPDTTGVQRFIAVVLTLTAWMYLVRSTTEELALVDQRISYRAVLARARTVNIADLESMVFTHQGFNLERGMETIEFRTFDKRVERVSLGPCWEREKLESFVRSVEEALHASEMDAGR
jgi:hypothetical protein